LNIDLQQRGVEFSQLFSSYNHLRESLLEKMPAMTINKINGANGNGDGEISENHVPTERITVSNGKSNTDTLLDLLGSGDDIIMSTPTAAPAAPAPAATSNLLDLLGDIDMSAPAVPVMITNNNNNLTSLNLTSPILDDNENRNIPDVMNGGSLAGNYDLGGLDFLSGPTTTSTARIVTALDKNDLLVQLATSTLSDHLQIIMTTTNNSMETLEEYLFQVSSLWLLEEFLD
jgi:AP-1 complex subunit gamma-1